MSSPPDGAGSRRPAAAAGASVGFAVAIVVVALNQRLAVASVGPLLNRLRHDLDLSSTAASVLTSAPVFCFGGAAVLGPWLARRIGLHRAVLGLVVTLAIGLVVRIGPDQATLFAGTLIAAGGIAAINVLLPVVVKRDFPARTGLMMGCYTSAVVGSAAVGAGLTVPVGDAIAHGWRAGLGIWVVPAIIAVVLWLPYVRGEHAGLPDVTTEVPARLRHDRLAWMVTAFFGLQSLSFYAVLSWLPSLYQDHGYSAAAAGGLLSLSTLVQLPVGLLLPGVATRMRRQESLVVLSVGLTGVGLAGILLAPTTVAPLWAVVLGLGQGGTFALGLTLLVLRTRGHETTAALSTMAQSIGYLIAGLGPLVVGALHAATHSWHPPLVFLLVLLVPEIVTGLAAAGPVFVRSTASP